MSSRASCSPRKPASAARSRSHTHNKGGSPLRHRCGVMAPPPGQTNRDTSAADHTTCFYCHQQLILVSHKVIVSRDAHGCSIRICEPCEKEARRRRPTSRRRASHPSHLAGGPLGRPTTHWSRRWRAGRRARHRAESRRRRLASFAVRRDARHTHLRRRSRSRRKMRVLRPCASSWAAPPTRRRRRVTNQLCLNLTRLLADEVADARKLLSD